MLVKHTRHNGEDGSVDKEFDEGETLPTGGRHDLRFIC